MTRKLFSLCGTLLALELGAFGAGSVTPVAAQEPSEAVTVYHHAPYTIQRRTLAPALGKRSMPVEQITVGKDVSSAGLNLSRPADRDQMNDRIRQAAVDSCRELDRHFPESIYMPVGSEDCVESAINGAVARLGAKAPAER